MHKKGLKTEKYQKSNLLMIVFTPSTLFLNRIDIEQRQHDAGNDSREDGEQQPYHAVHGILVGNRDDGLPRSIGTGNETGNTQEQSNQRTGDGGAELHGHRTAGEDESR